MKTTVNFFRTLLLAVLTLTFGACGEDSLLSELGLDGQTSTKVDEAGEVWDGTVATAFAGGSGTAKDPYLIANGAQLARFAAIVNGTDGMARNTAACGKLTADILLNDTEGWESWNETTAPAKNWTPIGSYEKQFIGILDGDGHSVSGIYINSTTNYQGLVGYLGEGGTLQNLGVKASYIKGRNIVGGLCGMNSGTMTNCYNTGSVTGTGNGDYVGGVCGRNNGNVNNCHNTGTVTGTGEYAGGLCGRNNGNVSNCYNIGSVEGNKIVGGLCGQNDRTVTNCYNIGSVAGNDRVGGVCGRNDGTVTNCYNTGSVKGNMCVGGVCGWNGGTVTNCYNNGSVEGNGIVGGLCGLNFGNVTNCYYQKDMAAGGINGSDAAGQAEAKTKTEFQSGEVAWLLQGEQEGQVWGQTIGTEDYPVLGGLKVYNNNGTYSNMAMDGDFYLISTADELRLFASMVNGGQTSISAKLTADIELNNTTGWENWSESNAPANSWTPIGSNANPFTGTFDGQGHTVSGIFVNSSNNCQGFFGATNGATIINLHTAQGYIRGNGSVGGIVGNAEGGSIEDCTNGCTIASTGNSNGGIVGYGMGVQITGCTNNGPLVAGQYQNGGIAGTVEDSTIDRCVNNADITVADHAGGIAAYNTNGTVSNCLNKGNVSTSNAFYTYTAGIVANNRGTGSVVKNCLNLGTISGQGGKGCRQNSIVCATDANGTRADNCYSIYISGVSVGLADNSRNVTDEELRSGEVASLLGDAWGQNIGSDGSPVLDSNGSTKVYAITIYNGTSIAETSYHNSSYSISLTGNAIALVDAGSPFSGKNIVVKDGNSYTCAELVLADGEDFYTPVPFTATKATYTRRPSVWAKNDGSGSGWETICLPFSGTLYADEDAKKPVDLESNNGAYWLRSLTDFESPNTLIFASPATAADHQIKAGVPYIIALPGNTFSGESLEGQTISVRGTNVAVIKTAQSVAAGSMFAFTGTFATKACNNGAYRLNSENGSDGAGNLFVLDTQKTVLAPFRCCIDVTGLNMGGASTRSASGLPKELRIGQ